MEGVVILSMFMRLGDTNMNNDPYDVANVGIPPIRGWGLQASSAARLAWRDIENRKDSLTERQWAWVMSHLYEGRSVGQIHGFAKETLTRHDFGNDYVLGRGCMRLLRVLLGFDVVVPSTGGAIELRTTIGSQMITWSDISAHENWFGEMQWARVTAYYRDRHTLAEINGGTHAGKRDRVIGHVSVRLVRLLLGLQVRGPRGASTLEGKSTGPGSGLSRDE